MWMASRGTLFHSLEGPVLRRVVKTFLCPPSEGIQRQEGIVTPLTKLLIKSADFSVS